MPCNEQLALPYWRETPEARWRLAGVIGLTLAGTGVRCASGCAFGVRLDLA